jgi:imidazolonepropionase-like amidohydrolase
VNEKYVDACIGASNYIIFPIIIILLAMIASNLMYGVSTITSKKKFSCETSTTKQITLTNPRVTSEIILLRNAILLNEKGQFEEQPSDILLEKGLISQIRPGGTIQQANARVIDLNQQLVTPGIIDAHVHLGVHSYPQLSKNNDVNEKANPLMPMVRVIDAFNPRDWALNQTMMAGVTTVQVLPGSANLMGGEIALVKTKTKSEHTNIDDILVRDKGVHVKGYKMAVGENPRRTYKTMSRLGHAAQLRQIFQEAKDMKLVQDKWDTQCRAKGESATPRPYNGSIEPLVQLLRYNSGEKVDYRVIVHVHCYRVVDIEMILRVSKEMGYRYDVLHHATEIHRLIDIIKENNLTVAMFSDQWGAKLEMYDASIYSPRDLNAAGIPVVIKTDHPVTPSKDLIFQLGKTHYYGFPQDAALKSVTSVAAKAIGLDHKLGIIKEGYDADLVAWDRHPLQLGAQADKVIIDGELLVDKHLPIVNKIKTIPEKHSELTFKNAQATKGYVVGPAKVYTMGPDHVIENAKIVVADGQITCLGATCITPDDHVEITLTNCKDGGCVIIPGLIESNSNLGMVEVSHEAQTQDGTSSAIAHQGSAISHGNRAMHAVDGLRVWNAKTIRAAWKAGITSSVTSIPGNFLVNGFSVLWHTLDMSSHTGLDTRSLILSDEVALHWKIGNEVKHGHGSVTFNSISGQIYDLRTLLSNADANCPTRYSASTCRATERVLKREASVVLHANKAEDINQVLLLQIQFSFKLTIMGGAEAHLLTTKLAAQNVSVILTPNGLQPSQHWDTMQEVEDYGLSTLLNGGVKVGIAYANVHNARNLRWLAGRMMYKTNLSMEQAIALITSNIVDILDLTTSTPINGNRGANMNPGLGRILLHTDANFVLFDGNPLTFEGVPRIVALGTVYDTDLDQE